MCAGMVFSEKSERYINKWLHDYSESERLRKQFEEGEKLKAT